MKSAYELAMERLEKASPTKVLTDEQKAKIAELDSLYQSKIAERETFLTDQIAKAHFQGDFEKAGQLQDEWARESRALRSEWEEKKEKLRSSFSG